MRELIADWAASGSPSEKADMPINRKSSTKHKSAALIPTVTTMS